MRKVILSRKGFDDTTGGKASPIYQNEFVSFPIPRVDSDIFYKELPFNETESYLDVMKDLKIKCFSEAHVDPDIRKSILPNRDKEWRGIFGQSDTSQSLLKNNQVGKGDLFLFFGWFREMEKIKKGYQYKKYSPDVHAIFGYLEVDEAYDVKDNERIPEWAMYHPHIKQKQDYDGKRNGIYIATKESSFNQKKKGWGTFLYDERLVLTKKGEKKRSVWELPPIFLDQQSHFKGKTHFVLQQNGNIEVRFSGMNNQELFISDKPEIVSWAKQLISTCKTKE